MREEGEVDSHDALCYMSKKQGVVFERYRPGGIKG